MAVILRDAPTGIHWGWYASEDGRMHLRTLPSEIPASYKVWLEQKGQRVFKAEGPIPIAILWKLKAEVAASASISRAAG